jgi:Xaa-Pro aminopeptidase
MRTSANIAAHAQRRCMQLSHVGVQERALATEFEYSIKMAGASRLAYPTMAGGGVDTCTIHYGRNDKRVRLNPGTDAKCSAQAAHSARVMHLFHESCWV